MTNSGVPGYRETDAGWIPEDWTSLSLGTIASARKSKAVAQHGVRCVELEHIEPETGRLLGWDSSGAQASIKTAFTQGDVLFGKLRPYLRKYAVAPFDGICTTEILAIHPKDDLADRNFLFQLMQGDGVFSTVEALSYGTKMPRVSWSDLADIVVGVPPLPEQRHIAAILTAVDDKLDVIARQIAATQTLKQGLMQTLFSRGVGTQYADGRWVPHAEQKPSALGMAPACWVVEPLDRYVSKVGSGVTPKGGSTSYQSSGIPLIRSQNVLVGRLSLDDVAYIDEVQHNKMRNSALEPEDVLLNITGASIGRCAVLPRDFSEGNVNQHVCIIRTLPSLNPQFLCQYINSSFGQKQVAKFQAGGNREGLNYQQVRSFDVPVPSVAEQEKIVDLLEAVDGKVRCLERKQLQHQTLKRGLMQKLLTGEWRVKVDTDMAA